MKIDLSDSKTDFSGCAIGKEDQVLVAMTSFGGRAPAVAIERLKKIAGNGANCTLVCVYGNRAYEDTLAEMEDAAKECGFQVVAAIAAVAQHSIITQYAANRPDASDEKRLAKFAQQYNESVALSQEYAKQGKALIISPDDTCGVDTLKKDRSSLQRLYEKGYQDGAKILNYLCNGR